MGYYEPSWSAEEQTMVDLMGLSGFDVEADINKEYTDVYLRPTNTAVGNRFRADTEYEALRKAFTYWTKHNA